MKSKVLLLLFVGSISLYGVKPIPALNRTNPAHVDAQQKSLEDLLKWHKMYQIATIAGLCTSLGFVGYKAYQSLSQPAPEEIASSGTGSNEASPLGDIDVQKLNMLIQYYYPKVVEKMVQPNRGWFMAHVHWVKSLFVSQLNSTANQIGVLIIFNIINNSLGPISRYIVGLEGILNRSVAALFHKNDLEWFLTSHVNIVEIFNNLEYYAALLEGKSVTIPASLLTPNPLTVDPVLGSDALFDFIANWNIYIQHMEAVLGFMHYKSFSHKNSLEAERMVAISSRVQDLINNFAQYVEEKVAETQNNDTKIMLYDDLRNLRAQLGFEVNSFRLLESSKNIVLPNNVPIKF